MGNAVGRTRYEPYNLTMQGYSDLKVSPELRVARFVGNAQTGVEEISMMSAFRAIEICHDEKFKLADILDSQIPSSGGKIKEGYRPYTDTQKDFSGYGYFPVDTYFTCRNSLSLAGVALKPVNAGDISAFVKDGKGAAQIEALVMLSPNQKILKVDDIILEVDGKRVENPQGVKSAIAQAKNKDSIPSKIVSDKKISVVNLKASDVTGLTIDQQEKMIRAVCANYPGASERPICTGKKK